MKYFFFFCLLFNIIFFLWEMNNGALNPTIEVVVLDPEAEKQILLLSELPKIKNEIRLAVNNEDIQNTKNDLVGNKETVTNNSDSLIPIAQSDQNLMTALILTPSLAKIETSEELLETVSDTLIKKALLIEEIVNILETLDAVDVNSKLKNNGVEKKLLVIDKPSDDEKLERQQAETPIILDEKLTALQPIPQTEWVEKKKVLLDQPASPVEIKSIAAKLNKQYCYQVGPFKNKAELYTWQKTNPLESSALKIVNKKNQVISGYLVHYPAGKTFSESSNNEKMIRKKGIKNLWLFRRGELKGTISLGLFVDENRAKVLKKKLDKKGLSVEIMPRYKEETALYNEIVNQDEAFIDKLIISDSQTASKQCEVNLD